MFVSSFKYLSVFVTVVLTFLPVITSLWITHLVCRFSVGLLILVGALDIWDVVWSVLVNIGVCFGKQVPGWVCSSFYTQGYFSLLARGSSFYGLY